jgi:hypothetical protein
LCTAAFNANHRVFLAFWIIPWRSRKKGAGIATDRIELKLGSRAARSLDDHMQQAIGRRSGITDA